jgi:predicted RNA-binding protein with PIN domain
MYFYIDGYNLMFSLNGRSEKFPTLRTNLIRLLQRQFARFHLSGTLVFDGSHRRDEESGLSYPSPLIVAYTSKGESADSYIVHKLEEATHPKQHTVVTNDKGLHLHVQALGAKVLSNRDFIHWLEKRLEKRREKEVEPKDSKPNLDRLLKIFEERLKDSEDC